MMLTTLSGCQDSPTSALVPGDPRFVEPLRLPGVTGHAGDCTQAGWTRNENGVCEAPPPPTSDPTDTGDPGSDPGGGGDGGESGDSPLPEDTDGDGDTLDEGPGAFALCMAIKLGTSGWSSIGGTIVTASMAWDARRGAREAYDAWDGYQRNTASGIIPYDVSTNDLYHKRWKDAEHQENLLYAGTAAAGTWAAAEILRAALTCAPYGAAPI